MPQLGSLLPPGAWRAYFWEETSSLSAPAPSAYSGNPRTSSHPGKVVVRPGPSGAQAQLCVCRWVGKLHIWRENKAKKRADPTSERHRGDAPHTLSPTSSHTDTLPETHTQAYVLTHSQGHSHCSAGHTNRTDRPKGGWGEGKTGGRAPSPPSPPFLSAPSTGFPHPPRDPSAPSGGGSVEGASERAPRKMKSGRRRSGPEPRPPTRKRAGHTHNRLTPPSS